MYPQGMPIPEQIWLDNAFYRRAGWERKFVVWPRRCMISNKLIWFKYAYKGTAIWTGPGEPAIEHAWHSSEEHLLWKLKGDCNESNGFF